MGHNGSTGERVRYSGSPLRYSFSEVHQTKQVLIVDLDAGGTRRSSVVAARSAETDGHHRRQPRRASSLRSAHDAHAHSWVQVTVTDPARPADLQRRVRERFPEALVGPSCPASGPLVSGAAGSTDGADANQARWPRRSCTTSPVDDITADELAVFDDRLRAGAGRRAERLMQLHRLTLCAIGPFAEPCDIDLERLGASGHVSCWRAQPAPASPRLIDAIVFALYGEVAGRSSSAERMHSDVCRSRDHSRSSSSTSARRTACTASVARRSTSVRNDAARA